MACRDEDCAYMYTYKAWGVKHYRDVHGCSTEEAQQWVAQDEAKLLRLRYLDDDFDGNLWAVLIDLETTGLITRAKANPKITEIACKLVNNSEGIKDTFHSLVDPTIPIPTTVTEKTGISNAMVAGAPIFPFVIPTLMEWVSNFAAPNDVVVLFAHKMHTFDQRILIHEFEKAGVVIPSNWRFVDTIPIFRAMTEKALSKEAIAPLPATNTSIPITTISSSTMTDPTNVTTTTTTTTNTTPDTTPNATIDTTTNTTDTPTTTATSSSSTINSPAILPTPRKLHIRLRGQSVVECAVPEETNNTTAQPNNPSTDNETLPQQTNNTTPQANILPRTTQRASRKRTNDTPSSSSSSTKKAKKKRVSYSLENIHDRCFGSKIPNQHRAMGDVEALHKCLANVFHEYRGDKLAEEIINVGFVL